MACALDTYFDKIFYISLDDQTWRADAMVAELKKWGIENFRHISGVVIEELPAPALYRNFNLPVERYVRGALGCRQAHWDIINLAKNKGMQRILILEDDCRFLRDPNQALLENQEILQDWDMLYFGGLVEPFFRNQVVTTHAYAVRSTLFDNILAMVHPSGMEIDNFYAKILHHMSFNGNQSGKYNIRLMHPFPVAVQDQTLPSRIK